MMTVLGRGKNKNEKRRFTPWMEVCHALPRPQINSDRMQETTKAHMLKSTAALASPHRAELGDDNGQVPLGARGGVVHNSADVGRRGLPRDDLNESGAG